MQSVRCLAHWLNTVPPVSLEQATYRSQVLHSTTEPLRSTNELVHENRILLAYASGNNPDELVHLRNQTREFAP